MIENNLRQQFEYTLSPKSPPPQVEPIEWFLLTERAGHCEYFASAMAAMCRSIGIQSRVVTGYLATEFNELTGYYVVRESNAHAWVEIKVVPGDGGMIPGSNRGVWETFDPTPPADLRSIHEPKTTLATRVKQLFETAEFMWINSVIGFGADSQSAVVGSVKMPAWVQHLDDRAEYRLRNGNQRLVISSLATGLAAFSGSLFFLTSLKLLWGRMSVRVPAWFWRPRFLRRFRLRIPRLRRSRAPEIEGFYSAILHALNHEGIPKPRATPLRRHVLESGESLATAKRNSFLVAVNILYRAKFCSGEITQEQRATLAEAVREVSGKPNKSDNPRRA